jgi:hypothetical protein
VSPCRRKRTRHVFHTLLLAEKKGRRRKTQKGEQTQLLLLLLSVADLSSVCAAVAAAGFEFSVSWSPKIRLL